MAFEDADVGPEKREETAVESREKSRDEKDEPNPYSLVGIGFEFAGVVALMAWCGWWLDGKLNTGPWLMITGLAVGVIGGTYKLWRIGKRFF